MNIKRICLLILFSPILILPFMLFFFVLGLVWGIEYALTGKYNQDQVGGW